MENYACYLRRFLDWTKIQNITKPEQLTLDGMRAYRLWLNRLHKEKPLKKNTQNYHTIAIRSFLKYLAKRDIKTLAPKKIELAKIPQRTVAFLEGDDLNRFLTAPSRTQEPNIIQKRDQAILEMLFSTGLRVSELAGLCRGSVNLSKDEFTVKGTGKKYRVVFLSPRGKECLRTYLDARKDSLNPLFIRHDRAFNAKQSKQDEGEHHLTPRSIQRLVRRYARIAGLTKKVTPHVMRHSFATDLLTKGTDMRSVQSLLGHASITTTQIYARITNRQLRDIHTHP